VFFWIFYLETKFKQTQYVVVVVVVAHSSPLSSDFVVELEKISPAFEIAKIR